MTAPIVKGWCPGAYRPMMSGDGLVVRIKPFMGRLSGDQALGLCDVADKFGNGTIDLTSRANLQVRGVQDHAGIIDALADLGLLDSDPERDAKRNIIVAPVDVLEASGGDISVKKKIEAIHAQLLDSMSDWPDLPNKMGIALDIGPQPVLSDAAADFRFEMAETGLILRADGCATGRPVTVENAADGLIELMRWFVQTGGPDAGRMKRHLVQTALSDRFHGTPPLSVVDRPTPGQYGDNVLVGVAFGQLGSDALRNAMQNVRGIQVTPWRMIVLEGTADAGAFITDAADPLLNLNACPGAPQCEQGLQSTRDLARKLAPELAGRTAHISGCSKGCAHPRATDVAIVGTTDGYDLVRNGAPWDTPARRGLTPDEILEELAR